MEQARWERLQEIYHQALALPPTEREAFLKTACAGNQDLLREVEALFEAAGTHARILDSPVVELGRASNDLVGKTIGDRYRVKSELPHGGMSQVYLADDLRLPPQQVVIKILSPALTENAYAQQKFDQEVETLSHMEDARIVKVLDKGELDNGRPYIVMPYIDGVPLRSQIPSHGMELERAASILKQSGEALDYVHKKEIFHRDLKPENIMLRRGTDSVVLIDFGIAKVRASLIAPDTVSRVTAGTLPYMSPEQLRGENLTPASDVYSMGIIAYEMLTGRRPFDPASASQLLGLQRAGIRVRAGQLRGNFPVEADRAIDRALRFEPRARYQTAGEFGNQLSSALLAKPVPPGSRAKWAKVLVGLIILAAVSYGVYQYIHRRTIISPPNRSFTYWLTVQKMQDGKEFQAPFKSNGEEDIFESGDKFQLNILASEPGYLYLFNEGPPEPNDTGFTMVYPNKETNNGSASLGANQVIQSRWITFRGLAGDENFWIVWSVLPVAELEAARTEALKHPRGGLTGDALVSLREFLRTKQLDTVYHYKADQRAVARGRRDMLITLAQFQHR